MCIRKGFTLIELLVVILIVILTLALLMPALSKRAPVKIDEVGPTSTGIVGEIVKELEWGNIVFNAPESMRFEETKTIELLLSASVSVQELQAQLNEVGEIESETVQISNRMEARLSGKGFEIEALVPDVQAVNSEGVTQWKWYVTPEDYGLQHLHLSLSAIIIVSGRDAPYVIKTFEHTIDVEVTPAQLISGFFSKHWKWLWAAILVPVAGYVWKRYGKAKQKTA
jgi:prepilin-type N-terminal cleavage/methylation domain-containing protein